MQVGASGGNAGSAGRYQALRLSGSQAKASAQV